MLRPSNISPSGSTDKFHNLLSLVFSLYHSQIRFLSLSLLPGRPIETIAPDRVSNSPLTLGSTVDIGAVVSCNRRSREIASNRPFEPKATEQ